MPSSFSGVISISQFLSEQIGPWYVSRGRSPVDRIELQNYGSRDFEFDLSDEPYPEMGVVDLARGAIVGTDGHAFTSDWRWIPVCSWHGDMTIAGSVKTEIGQCVHLSGTCLSLASDWAAGNFGHFLLDSLPRLKIGKRYAKHLWRAQ